MGEVGGAAADWFNDVGKIVTLGTIDAKKGRFYVPFSSGQMRNWGKGWANTYTGGALRKDIDGLLDTKEARLAGTGLGVVAGAVAGGVAGGAVGGGGAGGSAAAGGAFPSIGVATGGAAGSGLSSTGAALGALTAASVSQADALNQQMPELKVQKPLGNENTAVQKAVAEAASRRSRSRSGRSTILSQNFLSPSNPALKQTYGS